MAAFKPYEVIMRIDYGGAVQDGDALQVCMKGKAVQELVRCKDCRWRHDDSNPAWLPCNEVLTADDWFCGYGEKEVTGDGRKVNT